MEKLDGRNDFDGDARSQHTEELPAMAAKGHTAALAEYRLLLSHLRGLPHEIQMRHAIAVWNILFGISHNPDA